MNYDRKEIRKKKSITLMRITIQIFESVISILLFSISYRYHKEIELFK